MMEAALEFNSNSMLMKLSLKCFSHYPRTHACMQDNQSEAHTQSGSKSSWEASAASMQGYFVGHRKPVAAVDALQHPREVL